MISEELVDLSRLQFAATALYHFLFVPLTLGRVWLLVIMESVYVMTGMLVWKDMTRFWGRDRPEQSRPSRAPLVGHVELRRSSNRRRHRPVAIPHTALYVVHRAGGTECDQTRIGLDPTIDSARTTMRSTQPFSITLPHEMAEAVRVKVAACE